jgi:hypothetical protein
MAAIQLNREVPLEASRAVDVAPGQGDFGITDARIIAPGDPSRSTLVYRLASAGAGHMPPIGTSLVDHDGVTLIHDWVRTLGPASGPRPDIERLAGGVGRPAVAGSMADSHDDDATIRSLLASMPAALELAHMVREGRLPAAPRAAVPRPGANGVVELSPVEFLDRLANLVPPPRKHRHRYHGVFAPNHKLRRAVTALAIGNVGKQREAMNGVHGNDGRATGGCCDTKPHQKPRSHDTSRIAWAKLMARVGEEFPLECPACGGDIRLIAFITEPGPIRKILTHLGEPLEPPPIAAARGPPTDWDELVQAQDDRDVFQGRIDELPAIDIHSL